MLRIISICCCLSLFASLGSAEPGLPDGAYGGQPPLGPQDVRRHLFRPYTAVELNLLGGNYCENLLDMRLNIMSYTHLGFDSNRWDAWHLQFPDDSARMVEAFVWEDAYSGIARLETVRRLMKGLLGAHIPGTRGSHFFRHRSGGKTYLIFDHPDDEGRVLLSSWGDEISGLASVGFRAYRNGGWLEQKDFAAHDSPVGAGTPSVARSPENWNASPFVFQRVFDSPEMQVKFNGRYWLSDEDMPLEFVYESSQAEKLELTIGESGKHIPLLWDAKVPGIIEVGDGQTTWHSERDGDEVMLAPSYRYLVLRKNATWACPGYGSCLLVMWSGQPEAVEAEAENGYGCLRLVFGANGGSAQAHVWLYPFPWVNEDDMEYVFRNAESFLAQGRLRHNGFPSQQVVNAIPAGLAAGAMMLEKYHDPMALTARSEAINAVDAFLDPELKGRRFARLFFEVKAAAWMVQLARLLNDPRMAGKYEYWLKRTMDRLLSPEAGYDGKAWPDGWSHFNNMKAVWLAYEATGIAAYREAYERALDLYTIDDKGVYRNGEALPAPGGFEVYAGALPMAVWGHWGLRERVDKLINLQAPNGWYQPEMPVADFWNDAGAGPWAQDDSQGDMVGFMLRGYELPREPKHLLPTGAFPSLSKSGQIEATWKPIVDNPFFRSEERVAHTLEEHALPPAGERTATELDIAHAQQGDGRVTWRVDVEHAMGAALDIDISHGSCLVEVSPDGEHWLPRLDTWCDGPTRRSLDLSFLTGVPDELVRTLMFAPPDERPYLQSSIESDVVDAHCRTVRPDGEFVYRLVMPYVDQCQLEFLMANDYRIDLSADGAEWTEVLSPEQINPNPVDRQRNAAWLRIVDATPFVGKEEDVFVRFRHGPGGRKHEDPFGGALPYLRRVAAYVTYKTPQIYVRLRPAPYSRLPAAAVDSLRLRTW